MMPPRFYLLVLMAALLLAMLPLPYGYYQLLRVAACGLCAWSMAGAWQQGRQGAAGAWGLLALIYNPLIPIHLAKEIWMIVNLASAVSVGVLARQQPSA